MDIITTICNKTTIVTVATDLHRSVVTGIVFIPKSVLRHNPLVEGEFGTLEKSL